MKLKNKTTKAITKHDVSPGGFSYYKKKLKQRNKRLSKRMGPLNTAKITVVDNSIYLETDSSYSHIEIFYTGVRPTFENRLTYGHVITIKNKRIYIRNIYGISSHTGILLNYYGDFSISHCMVRGTLGGSVEAEIINNDADISMDRSRENVEDMERVIDDIEESKAGSSLVRPILNENSVKGLYSSKGKYVGHYHYWPDLKISMSGAIPHPESKPIFKNEFNTKSAKKAYKQIDKFVKFQKAKTKSLIPRKIDYSKYPEKVKQINGTLESKYKNGFIETLKEESEKNGKFYIGFEKMKLIKKLIKEEKKRSTGYKKIGKIPDAADSSF